MALQELCPCGTGASHDACCGRLHRGAADLSPDPGLVWTGLSILDSGEDWVEFG